MCIRDSSSSTLLNMSLVTLYVHGILKVSYITSQKLQGIKETTIIRTFSENSPRISPSVHSTPLHSSDMQKCATQQLCFRTGSYSCCPFIVLFLFYQGPDYQAIYAQAPNETFKSENILERKCKD